MTPISWALVVIGVVVSVAALLLMRPSAKAVGKPSAVALQTADTAKKVNALKTVWSGNKLPAVRMNIGWDFLLILGYTSLLAGLGGLLAPSAADTLRVDPRLLQFVALAIPAAAGACDVAENVTSLVQLDAPATDARAKTTVLFARAKWALIAIFIACLVLAAILVCALPR